MASLKIKCAKSEKIFEIPKKSLRFSIPLTNYFLKNNLEASPSKPVLSTQIES